MLVLGILVSKNNRLTAKEKRMFYLTYALVAISAIMEWLGILFNGDPSIPEWLLRTVKCADYILTPVAGAALIINIDADLLWKRIIQVVLAVNVVFQLVSAFTGWTLTVDAQHHYSHGPLYPAYMGLYSLLIVFLAFGFITYGNKFPRQNRLSLYAILVLVFFCIMLQEVVSSELRTAYIGLALGMIMMFIHITEFTQLRSDATIKVQKVAITTDVLTGVASRYAYAEMLNRLNSAETLPKDLTVFSIDINALKSVNDRLGHAAGDELICGAADCIQRAVGKGGVCYRTGGDEFIVISEMDEKQAQETLSRLKQNAAAWHGEKVGELYLSAGVARAVDYPGLTGEKLVIEADMAMYDEKADFYRNHQDYRSYYIKGETIKAV